MTGLGRINQDAIEKALAKRLERFQYCYEKALLSDATLAGNIMMGWTISAGGRPGSIRVVKSQMNNSKLNACMTKEIRAIRFPSPKGGIVKIKFPFNFTSSSL